MMNPEQRLSKLDLAQLDRTWLDHLRGRFLVFDGPDGSGKTTQYQYFREIVKSCGIPICEVREPGGTHLGEAIRKILLDPELSSGHEMDVYCELMLYMASRAQLVAERLKPAMAKGELILADRFISSTLAYQGTAGGIEMDKIESLGRWILRDCWPDVVVIFDVDVKTAAQRMNPLLRGHEFMESLDRMEQKDKAFHERVRQGYLAQVKNDPLRHLQLDASQTPEDVFMAFWQGLKAKVEAF